MTLRELGVPGVYAIEPALMDDERGFFARTFSADDFTRHGLETRIAECSIAFNTAAHTLRGLHYQTPPYEEAKVVRCTQGSVFDVVVDLRRGSPTRLHWCSIELTSENRLGLYVPPGCAHGYLTLEPETELYYQISQRYAPQAAAGARWDDPLLGIEWPAAPAVISERDASYRDLEPEL